MKVATVAVLFLTATLVHAKNRTWLRLLHYESNTGSSSIVNPDFFYSPKGSTDPEAELEATLLHIKNEKENTPEADRFACRFPARKRFLEKHLGISPRLHCPTFEAYAKHQSPDSISFVFSSQFLGNPASVMGHSFLRFQSKDKPALLGLALTYFAKIYRNDHPVIYAYKGLFGGYNGVFQIGKFYPKSHLYGSVENRDLWEYRLRFTTEERLFLFEHAHELAHLGQMRYYFLDRNCSYLLLDFLQLARDDLTLTPDRSIFVTPQEAIKILSKNHLIEHTDFRPSLRLYANAQYESLNGKQKKEVAKLVGASRAPEQVSDPDVLAATSAVLAMRESSEKTTASETDLFRRVTNQRAKYPSNSTISEQLKRDNLHRNPLYGHETLQASFGYTRTDLTSGLQLGFRPAAHSLDDLPIGFIPHTQLHFLDGTVRIEEMDGRARVKLRKFSFIDIKSLVPRSLVNAQSSWVSQMALVPTLGSTCVDCRALRVSGSIGGSTDLAPRILGYLLGGGTLDVFVPDKKLDARLGPAIFTGLISQVTASFFFKLESKLEYFFLGPYAKETILTTEASLTWQATTNTNISLSGLEATNLREREFDSTDIVVKISEYF